MKPKRDVKLDEKEYQQMSFSYASAKVSGDDLSDDDIKKNKENLQKFYDKVKEDPLQISILLEMRSPRI